MVKLNLVFSGDGPNRVFVEAENEDGKSVTVGEWLDDERGFKVLSIDLAETYLALHKDQRWVYGARCSWNGSIHHVGTRMMQGVDRGIPCCPLCGGVLFEVPSRTEWRESVDAFNKLHPGYAAFIEWEANNGKCWPTQREAYENYRIKTGKTIDGWVPK